MTLRAFVSLSAFLLWTVLLIPVQMLLLRMGSPLMRRLPYAYHNVVAWLLRVKVRRIGQPSAVRPTLFISNAWPGLVQRARELGVSIV